MELHAPTHKLLVKDIESSSWILSVHDFYSRGITKEQASAENS